MMRKRKAVPTDIRQLVLHEAGYLCGNPSCRRVLTLDIHHLQPVSKEGSNAPANLLPLCPNCHSQHHAGLIPETSLRAWKFLLLSLNEAFRREDVDMLLMLDTVKWLYISSDRVIDFSSLIASDMIQLYERNYQLPITAYHVTLSEKGKTFVTSWKKGDQSAAIGATNSSETSPVLPIEAEPMLNRKSEHAEAFFARFPESSHIPEG